MTVKSKRQGFQCVEIPVEGLNDFERHVKGALVGGCRVLVTPYRYMEYLGYCEVNTDKGKRTFITAGSVFSDPLGRPKHMRPGQVLSFWHAYGYGSESEMADSLEKAFPNWRRFAKFYAYNVYPMDDGGCTCTDDL